MAQEEVEKEVDLEEKTEPTYPTRNLYKTTKVSIKALNVFIVIGIVAIIGCLVFLVGTNGFTITFESYGGTAVESQVVMYGELLSEPEDPVREGYTFDGWYWDYELNGEAWDFSVDTVDDNTFLYAKWVEAE
ncbi:MAG: InlB B-repeat-containing protein [Clostridia bacterium]